MPHCIVRDPAVGYWTDEKDYNRRLNAHREMFHWWASTLIAWGIRTGTITRYKKENNLQ